MIDLHTHTIHSDGSYTTEELLKEASLRGLSLLSITDHNTIQAHFDLHKKAIRDLFPNPILSGIEITTTYLGETIEILGYGFSVEKMQPLLAKHVLTFSEKQQKEFELIKTQYRKIGVHFDEAKISFDPNHESSRVSFVQEIKRYPENFRFFLHQETITSNSGFTRMEVYNPKSPLYVDESSLFPSLEEAISMIHKAGGLAFLAHPFAYSPNIPQALETILDHYELDGLECFYTTFTQEQSDYLVNLAKKRGLFMCGGSDFHGSRKINHQLGTGNGHLQVKEEIVLPWVSNYVEELKQKVKKYES